jgi:hypothetical protein
MVSLRRTSMVSSMAQGVEIFARLQLEFSTQFLLARAHIFLLLCTFHPLFLVYLNIQCAVVVIVLLATLTASSGGDQ